MFQATDIKSSLVQVMAWICTGDKQLPEPMMTQFTDINHHISNKMHTKSQNLNVSHLVLQLSLPNPLKFGVK